MVGRLAKLSDIVKEAKKEGRLNVIALPPDWANYGEIISTFSKKYGIPITSDSPDASSAQENQSVRSFKGDSARSGRPRREPEPGDRRCERGTLREVLHDELQEGPARDEGRPGLLGRRLLGRGLVRVNRNLIVQPAEDVEGPAQAGVQGQGRAQRQPAHVRLGRGGRVLGRDRERRQR